MRTLEDHIAADGPLPVRDALGWVVRAGLALAELHAAGHAHGELSVAAIEFAERDCRGAGRLRPPTELDPNSKYHSLARSGHGAPSLQDDVWALGLILYFALTGALPYPDGVAAAVIDRRKLRAPRPLAVYRAELDVMQPVVDCLVRVDYGHVPETMEGLLQGLLDFSPAIANLEALPYEHPSVVPPTDDIASDQSAPAPGPAATRPSHGVAVSLGVVVGLVVAVGVFAMWTSSRPAQPTAQPPERTAPPPLPQPSSSVAAVPADAASPATSATAEHGGDLVACTSALFAGDAYGTQRISIDFPCGVVDAKRGVAKMTAALARGGGGQATKAAREWSVLGWYQVAAFAVARAHCCAGAGPVETDKLLGVCKVEAALAQLSTATMRGTDDQLAAGFDAYRAAVACASTAGRGSYFGQKQPPSTAQATMFLRMLTRLRASKR